MARIKMVVGGNEFEAEGDEAFLKSLYEDFRLALASANPRGTAGETPKLDVPADKQTARSGKSPGVPKHQQPAAPKKKASKTVSADRTLDLRPDGKQPFADFVAQKNPVSNHEKNVVSVYYLTEVLGQQTATVSQVMSCYDDRSWRTPNNIKNSLSVTATSKGWLNTQNFEEIGLEVKGRNHVKHDMPAGKGE